MSKGDIAWLAGVVSLLAACVGLLRGCHELRKSAAEADVAEAERRAKLQDKRPAEPTAAAEDSRKGGGDSPPTRLDPDAVVDETAYGGVTFKFKKANWSGGKLEVRYTATSERADKTLRGLFGTRLYAEGILYQPGPSLYEWPIAGLMVPLPAGVSVIRGCVYEGIPRDLKKIDVYEMDLGVEPPYVGGTVKFRNIRIGQE